MKAIYNPPVAAALESENDEFELRDWEPFDMWPERYSLSRSVRRSLPRRSSSTSDRTRAGSLCPHGREVLEVPLAVPLLLEPLPPVPEQVPSLHVHTEAPLSSRRPALALLHARPVTPPIYTAAGRSFGTRAVADDRQCVGWACAPVPEHAPPLLIAGDAAAANAREVNKAYLLTDGFVFADAPQRTPPDRAPLHMPEDVLPAPAVDEASAAAVTPEQRSLQTPLPPMQPMPPLPAASPAVAVGVAREVNYTHVLFGPANAENDALNAAECRGRCHCPYIARANAPLPLPLLLDPLPSIERA